jgi:hypothetical protein
MAIERVTPDRFGLDEVFAQGCQVHIERMSDGHVWIAIECGPDKLFINLHSTAAILANFERATG